MLSRRIAALLIGLLSLHLNFVGVDFACADHASGRATAHSVPAAAHHVTDAHATPATDAESCEIPTQPDCCRAMASCAVNVALDEDAGSSSMPVARDALTGASSHAPRSLVTPPEPPPPRA